MKRAPVLNGAPVGRPDAERPSWQVGGGPDHVLLDVSVVPGARRTALAGLHDGALRIQLSAPPVDGKANAALERYVAGLLGLPQRGVQVLRGQTSRRKTLRADCSADQAKSAIAALLAAGDDGE
jgi:uncharacterized protein (TIGR00251 family)